MKMYSIYDSKVKAYMQPFFMRTKGEVIRSLMNELQQADSNLAKHPGDYTLFEIADWDEQAGKLEPYKTHESIGIIQEFIKTENKLPKIAN